MKLGLEADRATHPAPQRPHLPVQGGVRRPVTVRRHLVGGADPSGPEEGFRTDIEGLRAVAVISVVAYHLELRGFSGGFVGVDVFFVISGFLITRRLLRGAVEDRAVPDSRLLRGPRPPDPADGHGGHRGHDRRGNDLAGPTAALAVDGCRRPLRRSVLLNLRFVSQGTDYMAEADAPSLFLEFWVALGGGAVLPALACAPPGAGRRRGATLPLDPHIRHRRSRPGRGPVVLALSALRPPTPSRRSSCCRAAPGRSGSGPCWRWRAYTPGASATPLAPWLPSEVWRPSRRYSLWSFTTCPRSGRAAC